MRFSKQMISLSNIRFILILDINKYLADTNLAIWNIRNVDQLKHSDL